ncbi:MAG: PEGA domain-containing protein [Proteobacteria bacterium]|nr:PEGA domain-containing protein [Pseudomonadota bacterium]
MACGAIGRWGCAAAATFALGVSLARAAPPEPRVRVTVLLLPAAGISAKDTGRFSRALQAALQTNRRLEVRDADSLLAEFAGEVPQGAVAEAAEATARGLRLLTEGPPAAAASSLAEAVEALVPVLPFIKKQLLADAMLGLGVALAQDGRKRDARAALQRLFVWRPQHQYDVSRFPAEMIPVVEQARAAVERLGRGGLQIDSQPPGAQAYVDGRFVGVTPTIAFGLTVGDHYLTFKKAGFVRAGGRATVDARQQQTFVQPLSRSEKYLLLQQAIAQARTQLGAAKAPVPVADAGRVLFVHQIIFAELRPLPGSMLEVRAYLYDLRSGLRLNQVKLPLGSRDQRAVATLAHLLYANVPYDGRIEAPPEPPPPRAATATAFHRRWWFWTAIGAGAAVVATAIAVPLSRQGENCPAGFRCVAIDN